MADNMRWRWGDTKPVRGPVDIRTVIEIGDLVYKWASTAWTPREADSRRMFTDNFHGVAMNRSRYGDTDPIRVATHGVFEFRCEPATFERESLIALRWAGDCSDSQMVAPTNTLEYAIAVVARHESVCSDDVLIDISPVTCECGKTFRLAASKRLPGVVCGLPSCPACFAEWKERMGV